MKKIHYLLSVLCLGVMMFINLNLTLNTTFREKITFDKEALGQIYDAGELGEATITCASNESACFRGTGCRCYKSTFGYCPNCGAGWSYYCGYTGYQDDICGMFELNMQNFPGTHKIWCSYR